jgi:hypothetical protein
MPPTVVVGLFGVGLIGKALMKQVHAQVSRRVDHTHMPSPLASSSSAAIVCCRRRPTSATGSMWQPMWWLSATPAGWCSARHLCTAQTGRQLWNRCGSRLLQLHCWSAAGGCFFVLASFLLSGFGSTRAMLHLWRPSCMLPVLLWPQGQPADPGALAQHVASFPGAAAGVLLDCTASDVLPQHYTHWLGQLGLHIITPNKQLGSGPLTRYQQLRDLQRSTGALSQSHALWWFCQGFAMVVGPLCMTPPTSLPPSSTTSHAPRLPTVHCPVCPCRCSLDV